MTLTKRKKETNLNNLYTRIRRESNMKSYMTNRMESHKRIERICIDIFNFLLEFDGDCFSHYVKNKNVFSFLTFIRQ